MKKERDATVISFTFFIGNSNDSFYTFFYKCYQTLSWLNKCLNIKCHEIELSFKINLMQLNKTKLINNSINISTLHILWTLFGMNLGITKVGIPPWTHIYCIVEILGVYYLQAAAQSCFTMGQNRRHGQKLSPTWL